MGKYNFVFSNFVAQIKTNTTMLRYSQNIAIDQFADVCVCDAMRVGKYVF